MRCRVGVGAGVGLEPYEGRGWGRKIGGLDVGFERPAATSADPENEIIAQ